MKRKLYLLLFTTCIITTFLQAQDASLITPVAVDTVKKWITGAGLGMDFAQLFQLNPRQGAGQNRVGFGGATNFFAKYKKERMAWDNLASWQVGLQRLGSGPIAQGTTVKIPFQKAIDELRLNSKVGYKTSEISKFFYAADFSFLSQVVPTYTDVGFPGNFPQALSDTSVLLSRFFAPATLTLSAGMDYKPTPNLSIYYSPIGAKMIIVGDDEIAATGVHGNPVTKDAAGNIVDFKNVDMQLGSLLRLGYAQKFFNDRMTYLSSMLLFSNYLQNTQNIDVDWTNELGLTIFKGFQLSMTANIFYDDDIKVQITDYEAPNGVRGVGKRVSFTQQLLLKYNVVF